MSAAYVSARWDVVIAGAGPAGVATAVALLDGDRALRGRVLVLDRARFPRDKPCGGGLTGRAEEAMRALGLGLRVPALPSPRARVRYGAVERAIDLPRPVTIVRRIDFDASLVAQARERGVEVREGTPLEEFAVGPAGVTVRAGGEQFEARVLVGADGAGSLVRRRLDGGERERPLRMLCAEVPARGAPDEPMLYDFSPMADGLRGYLWKFPAPGGLWNVGLLHAPSPSLGGAALERLARARLSEQGVHLGAIRLRGWPAWGYRAGRRVAAEHVITVGDAAGIDALTGEGIAVALEQGRLAARAILDGLARGDLSFAGYRHALRRATVGRDLALDALAARLLYGAARPERWLALVLHDPAALALWAGRVSGTLVLADHKPALVALLARHLAARALGRRRLVGPPPLGAH